MEGFTSKKKEDFVPAVESNENIQSQIEEQVQMLNPKLDALKVDIDAMGGMEGLNEAIKKNKDSLSTTALMVPTGAILVLASLFPLLLSTHDGLVFSKETQDMIAIVASAIGAVAGASITGIGSIGSLKNWWGKINLNSLKNNAEIAGIA